ncbi:MAG: hypothetical protein ACK5NA_04935 [Enterococcus sp.]
MKIERWQDINDKLVSKANKAIIISDKDSEYLKDTQYTASELAENGRAINKVRQKLIRDTVKREVRIDPLQLSGYFDKLYEGENAEKAEKLETRKPTHQFKQIKSNLEFFGESFLEGFLDFYGLEVDNAVSRYESNLQILETQELGMKNEPKYYLAQSQKGELSLATLELPSHKIASEELHKVYTIHKVHRQQQN